jgi:DNA-binding NtrC family response regulator
MQQVFRAIGRLSRSSVNVLITGDSGTGKELAARALHEHSPRANKPFIALNTSAIPAELLESELFGHEKGAFTGADSLRRGRFEQADGGSLFLDEIGDMSTSLQTRLLRVLAEGEFYRVGGQTPIRVDVRVIAATHQNLEDRVRLGLFREDLFHRLNVIRIELPPLRARREDVPDLLEHYMHIAAQELGRRAQDAERGRATTSCAPMRGPATCANWSTCAAASRCWRRVTRSAPKTCRRNSSARSRAHRPSRTGPRRSRTGPTARRWRRRDRCSMTRCRRSNAR